MIMSTITLGGHMDAILPLQSTPRRYRRKHSPEFKATVLAAILENKDIGFVSASQVAAVKVETFNYTKYGLLEGQVRNVSLDAIPDEKLGLVYQAKVKLKQNKMNIDGRWVNLAPGMAVSVEVKTGQRRIIEYFLLTF